VRSVNSSVAVTVIKESTALPLGIPDGGAPAHAVERRAPSRER
jgi:hypothetical protein